MVEGRFALPPLQAAKAKSENNVADKSARMM
jgi:hypothetical protein